MENNQIARAFTNCLSCQQYAYCYLICCSPTYLCSICLTDGSIIDGHYECNICYRTFGRACEFLVEQALNEMNHYSQQQQYNNFYGQNQKWPNQQFDQCCFNQQNHPRHYQQNQPYMQEQYAQEGWQQNGKKRQYEQKFLKQNFPQKNGYNYSQQNFPRNHQQEIKRHIEEEKPHINRPQYHEPIMEENYGRFAQPSDKKTAKKIHQKRNYPQKILQAYNYENVTNNQMMDIKELKKRVGKMRKSFSEKYFRNQDL